MSSSTVNVKPNRWDLLIVGLILLLTAGCSLLFYGNLEKDTSLDVTISVGNEAPEVLSLSDFPVEGMTLTGNGITLTVMPTDTGDGLYVSESTCPNQDCVHTGTIRRAGQSLICLPAKIVISLTSADSSSSAPDAVLG